MAPSLPSFNPARFRSYLFRLPLFTRIVISLIFLFWISQLQSTWNIFQWGALIPREVGFSSSKDTAYLILSFRRFPLERLFLSLTWFCAVYRLNTYPFIHLNLLHALLNVIALLPLLERFEAEHGTLLSAAMFAGRIRPSIFWKMTMADLVVVQLFPHFLLPHTSWLSGDCYAAILLLQGLGGNKDLIFSLNSYSKFRSVWVFVLLGIESIKAFRTNPYFAYGLGSQVNLPLGANLFSAA